MKLLATIVWIGVALRAWGDERPAPNVPAWLYPLSPPSSAGDPAYDEVKPIRIPNSALTHTEAELFDRFFAADWYPDSHSQMPEVVAHGRKPDVFACGYCHTPGGQGRPENAALAGLSASYIVQQVADFKNGARHSAGPAAFLPFNLMIDVAAHASDDEVESAAAYFSQQQSEPRVRVVEAARVPRAHVVGWVYVADPGKATEPLGQRLLEFAPDATLHEHRDDAMVYVAYAPVGSLNRGRNIAMSGAGGLTQACVSCHGDKLQGSGPIPRLAGRSPSYLMRQLVAFQTGADDGDAGQAMLPVVARLAIGDMIDVTAYAAALNQ